MTTASTSPLTDKPDTVPHSRVDSESLLESSYFIGEKIGQGSFGKVYKVIDKKTGERWAMKCVSKQKASMLEREVEILKKVRHEHIIMLKEVFETPDKVFLIMEYCGGGELAKKLGIAVKFPEEIVKKIMSSLVSAISYLHKCELILAWFLQLEALPSANLIYNVVHRDLKLSNILLNDDPTDDVNSFFIKVTDFGLSVVKEGVRQEDMLDSFCGTLNYIAPEIAENKNYSQQCDVWAMGVIAYNLFCGYPPFYANDEKELIKKIRSGKITFKSTEWDDVSNEAKEFITKLLQVDPSYRLTAAEALNHPWLTGNKDDSKPYSNILEMMEIWQDDLKKEHLKKTFSSESKASDDKVNTISKVVAKGNTKKCPTLKKPHTTPV